MEQNSYIGIDIGGTKCAVVYGRYDGEQVHVLDKVKMPTAHGQDPLDIIDGFSKIAEELIEKHGSISGIGVSCGGPLDSKRGLILAPPNLPDWDRIPICKILNERFQQPAHLQNDANACAIAEWKFGAGKGCENMIFLTFGTGMGAGLILNGRIYAGSSDMAGEVGHMRLAEFGPTGYGKLGSFEGFCSGSGLAQIGYILGTQAYQRGECPAYFDPRKAPEGITAKTIADAADAGDKTALEVYCFCGEYLGKGLSVLIDLFNPDKIVIGSIFARSRELLWPAAKEVIERESLSYAWECCEVVPAALEESIGDVAALATAIFG